MSGKVVKMKRKAAVVDKAKETEKKFNEAIGVIKKNLDGQIKVSKGIATRIRMREDIHDWFGYVPDDIEKLTKQACEVQTDAFKKAKAVFAEVTIDSLKVKKFVDPLEAIIDEKVTDDWGLFLGKVIFKAIAEYDRHIWNLVDLVNEE